MIRLSTLTSRLGWLVLRTMPLLVLVAGCGRGPETSYGSSRGESVNGTGALAGLLQRRGHEVRAAWRLSEELAAWADVVVRFAQSPGAPDRDEAAWYEEWLESGSGRSLIYIVRDYDAEAEYWSLVLEELGDGEPERRAEAEARRDRAARWVTRLPRQEEHPADAQSWFAAAPAVEPPAVCKKLDGPFARGVDAGRAALPVHSPLTLGPENLLLAGDGNALAIEWEFRTGSRVLALANAAFLLNIPLVNPERRLLSEKVLAWIGDGPLRIAFVEGFRPLGGVEAPPSLFDLVARVEGFRWAAIQLGLFGLLASLARAPRLGRPRPEPASDADRPVTHAEALGALLERSRSPAAAREILASYRRWRSPQGPRAPLSGPGARRGRR